VFRNIPDLAVVTGQTGGRAARRVGTADQNRPQCAKKRRIHQFAAFAIFASKTDQLNPCLLGTDLLWLRAPSGNMTCRVAMVVVHNKCRSRRGKKKNPPE